MQAALYNSNGIRSGKIALHNLRASCFEQKSILFQHLALS